MPIAINGRLEGYKEAVQAVRNVANGSERIKIIRNGIYRAGMIVRDQYKSNVNVGGKARKVKVGGAEIIVAPGALRDSVRATTRVKTGAGDFSYGGLGIVGVDGVAGKVVAGNRKRGVFWAHFIEKGTKSHSILAPGVRSAKRSINGSAVTIVRGKNDRHPGNRAFWPMQRSASDTAGKQSSVFRGYCEVRINKLMQTGAA